MGQYQQDTDEYERVYAGTGTKELNQVSVPFYISECWDMDFYGIIQPLESVFFVYEWNREWESRVHKAN